MMPETSSNAFFVPEIDSEDNSASAFNESPKKTKNTTYDVSALICDEVFFRYEKKYDKEVDALCVALLKHIKNCSGLVARSQLLFPFRNWYKNGKSYSFTLKKAPKEFHNTMIDFVAKNEHKPDSIDVDEAEKDPNATDIAYAHCAIDYNIPSEFHYSTAFPLSTLCYPISMFSAGFDVSPINFSWSKGGPIDVYQLLVGTTVIHRGIIKDALYPKGPPKEVVYIERRMDLKVLSIMAKGSVKTDSSGNGDIYIAMMNS